MKNVLFYTAGSTPACFAAAKALQAKGVPIADHITPEATHLLLDIPSFSSGGTLRSGADFAQLMALLPEDITLIGGRLPENVKSKYPSLDLLEDNPYQYENAAITAECALRVAGERIPFALRGCPVLIVGWGRIGKHLAFLLQAHGSRVTILSRSQTHRAEAASFGLRAIGPEELPGAISGFRILFNTAPGRMIPEQIAQLSPHSLKIDLASTPGIEGPDVIRANGLPGRLAPESSGQLIADTILRLIQEEGL